MFCNGHKSRGDCEIFHIIGNFLGLIRRNRVRMPLKPLYKSYLYRFRTPGRIYIMEGFQSCVRAVRLPLRLRVKIRLIPA